VTENWWATFFSGPWAELHSEVAARRTEREIETIERMLELPAAAKLLDVPCGDGRLAIELAARGYEVTGVDITPEYLDRARRTAAARGVELSLEERDMRDLPWKGKFDGAICYWGSFGYFDDDGNQAFLTAVAEALDPAGCFLLEGHVIESLLPRFERRTWSEIGDTYLLEDRNFDHRTSRIETTWTFLGPAAPDARHTSIRLYTYRELMAMFEGAGFGSTEGFDAFSEAPFEFGSQRLLMRARK
jgi:cyclopropane fatty-acyl-phospholipid synthase-like methyltransferase